MPLSAAFCLLAGGSTPADGTSYQLGEKATDELFHFFFFTFLFPTVHFVMVQVVRMVQAVQMVQTVAGGSTPADGTSYQLGAHQ